MRTFNFANTIRRVFAIRNDRATNVTSKRSGSPKASSWLPVHAPAAWAEALRFVMCHVQGVVRPDVGQQRLTTLLGRLRPCSVAAGRVFGESVRG